MLPIHRVACLFVEKATASSWHSATFPKIFTSNGMISYKNVLSMILENIFLLKELLTCGSLYHPWLSKHRHLIV